jgi:hypothetical protein
MIESLARNNEGKAFPECRGGYSVRIEGSGGLRAGPNLATRPHRRRTRGDCCASHPLKPGRLSTRICGALGLHGANHPGVGTAQVSTRQCSAVRAHLTVIARSPAAVEAALVDLRFATRRAIAWRDPPPVDSRVSAHSRGRSMPAPLQVSPPATIAQYLPHSTPRRRPAPHLRSTPPLR